MQNKDLEYVRSKIQRRLKALQEWPTQDKTKVGGASRIAEDIARGYSFIGDKEEAKNFFELAADYANDELKYMSLEGMRADHAGLQYFTVARLYWRTGESLKANQMFKLALNQFESGFNHKNESVRLTCFLNAIYCMIFTESLNQAFNLAVKIKDLDFLSDIDHKNLATQLLLNITKALTEDETKSFAGINLDISKYLELQGHTTFSASPHPLVDIHEFIQKKVNR